MKYFVVILILAAFPVFAEGESEAGSALVEEIAQTIMESKDAISEYSVLAVKGLVARTVAYFDVVFPLIPILAVVGLLMLVVPLVGGLAFDWDLESVLMIPIIL